jgi:hypothetical protein
MEGLSFYKNNLKHKICKYIFSNRAFEAFVQNFEIIVDLRNKTFE